MRTAATRLSATVGLLCATMLVAAGCGGGGGGGHGSGVTANATVRGHVAAVNGASTASGEGGASADTVSCTGIIVRAERDGEEVAETTTTASCDFDLPVQSGHLPLEVVPIALRGCQDGLEGHRMVGHHQQVQFGDAFQVGDVVLVQV